MVLGNAVNASQTGFQSLNATNGAWNGRTLTAGAGISITNGNGTAKLAARVLRPGRKSVPDNTSGDIAF